MGIAIFGVGRMGKGPEAALYEAYVRQADGLAKPLGLAPVSGHETVESRKGDARSRAAEEASALNRLSARAVRRYCLDERGKALSSPDFARFLADERATYSGDLVFALGGPDGHDPTMREAADLVLSLGPMTLPHRLARVVLAEQIYRAMTILANHPYHRA